MADAFALASAAAERRKATRKSALPPESGRAAQSAPVSAGGDGWHAPFGAPLPPFLRGAESLCGNGVVVVGKARTRARRENDLIFPPRSAVEGACGGSSWTGGASVAARAPSTVLLRRHSDAWRRVL